MKTVMAKPETVKRDWYVVDAAGLPMGRVASQVAALLRGKNKPCFTPHVDTGDYVIVINTDKMILTGNKMDQKIYFRYSGFPGGDKYVKYGTLMKEKSDFAMEKAVKGMLPKNTLGRQMFKKLKVYKGDTHPHAAQQPKEYKIKGGAR